MAQHSVAHSVARRRSCRYCRPRRRRSSRCRDRRRHRQRTGRCTPAWPPHRPTAQARTAARLRPRPLPCPRPRSSPEAAWAARGTARSGRRGVTTRLRARERRPRRPRPHRCRRRTPLHMPVSWRLPPLGSAEPRCGPRRASSPSRVAFALRAYQTASPRAAAPRARRSRGV